MNASAHPPGLGLVFEPISNIGNKEVPPIHNKYEEQHRIQDKNRLRVGSNAQERSHPPPVPPVSAVSYKFNDNVLLYSAAGSRGRAHSWPPNLNQPMLSKLPSTTSPQKAHHPVGLYPRFDEISPKKYQQPPTSHMSDDSSSAYSQPSGLEPDLVNRHGTQMLGSAPSPQSKSTGARASYLGAVQHKQVPQLPVRSLRHRDRAREVFTNRTPISPVESSTPLDHEELSTLQEMLEEEQKKHQQALRNNTRRQGRNFTKVELGQTIHRPLTIQIKPPTSPQSPKRTSVLTNMRESFSRGVDELTSPSKSKHFGTPTFASPTSSQSSNTFFTRDLGPYVESSQERSLSPPNLNSPLPPLPRKEKRTFSTGRHPLKSPFPFGSAQARSSSEDEELKSPSTPGKLNRKLSGAMKSISKSRSTRNSPMRKNSVITNKQRTPTGPDTPLPLVSGFTEQIQDAVATAKKSLRVKTADEKKREGLKKKIVVLGITDQSPNGNVTQWL